jgi:Protein of unknown function (DUF3987)
MSADSPFVWPDPIPLGEADTPPFPSGILPDWLEAWAQAEAIETQTPVDLAAMLGLAVCAGGIARKARVLIRGNWSEPTNLFVCVSLRTGERKSSIFARAMKPVHDIEARLIEESAVRVAEAQAEREMIEKDLRNHQSIALSAKDDQAKQEARQRVKEIARELASHKVPARPCLILDDVMPESVSTALAEQDGRLMVAGPEGTIFEIIKGRYSDKPSPDVFLKGHSGGDLRVKRRTRDEMVKSPALTMAVTAQPDVISSLAEAGCLEHRGFLARFFWSIPRSRLGDRDIITAPVPL